ncbi:uncharacterized protein LOC120355032 isoform X2 [Nilaparvata lugens]|nr:uncharacterized protein LOC120354083 [Nilaparvata lugens]XP_039299214.1 uncharacterized protein LOC120355032 isoform X2 [Nilaparvata lugens]XP_039299215.1 uncharacterized protein LOC120355032 isoform X2 [Nilaparvata lugens]
MDHKPQARLLSSLYKKMVTSINGNVILYKWTEFLTTDIKILFEQFRPIILEIMLSKSKKFNGNVKWFVSLHVKLRKIVTDVDQLEITPTFHGKSRSIINIHNNVNEFHKQWEEAENIINEKFDKFIQNGSGWVIDEFQRFDLNIVKYSPIHGTGSYVLTPKRIAVKRVILNIRNEDDLCFVWSVLAYFHNNRTNNRVSDLKKLLNLININDLNFPLILEDISKFEKQNPTISINVVGYENEIVYPLLTSENQHREHKITLLLLESNGKKHYTLVRNLFRLCSLNSSESSFIPIPKFITDKKAIVNVKSDDSLSFIWSVLAFFHNKRTNRVGDLKKLLNLININDLNFPLSLEDISKFEKQNPTICINVIAHENHTFYPLLISKNKDRQHKITLLLLSSKDKKYYTLVKNLSRLLSNYTKHGHKVEICPHCFHRFTRKNALQKLNNHIESCSLEKTQRVEMPQKGHEILTFKNFSYTLRVPYIIYADLECLIINGEHIPCGYGYVIVNESGNIHCGPKIVRANSLTESETLIEKFIGELDEYGIILKDKLKQNIPMTINSEENRKFLEETLCCLCNKRLLFDRVRHHSHSNGMYLGAAHNNCNLNAEKVEKIPVVFHNFSGYDSHFIIQALTNYKKKISCIAKTSEKIISITLNDTLRFIDSLNFLNSSLEKLAEINSKFDLLSKHFSSNKADLLKTKQFYPYEYMNSFERFQETKLPTIDKFYSRLTDSQITETEYQHAQNIWKHFNIKNLAEYHDLYLKTDILLLADIFQNFRTSFMRTYNLDPAHFFSLPHYSWFAMLKITGVELELLTDIDMHLFFEKGIRGGISVVPKRYAKANNRYMSNFNINEPETYIIYWDCNNLYAVGMSGNLPHSKFEWMSEREIEEFDPQKITDSSLGYMLEVDLEYPSHLQSTHNCFPLAPLKETPPTGRYEKLITTFTNKEKYVIYSDNLKLYLELGMVLKKVHRGIKFEQSRWMKPFIDMNTQLRTVADNEFDRTLYKLINNSCYGRTLMNVKNHTDFEIVMDEEKLDRIISKPRVKNWFPYNENVTGVCLNKIKVVLNKPIFVGAVILEHSKNVMYDFHYNQIKNIFKDKCEVLMSDTDSFMYVIQTEDIYEDIRKYKHLFDTSNFPKNHPCYNEENKKVIGKFKDENGGRIITEFIGLQAKMYSFIFSNCEEKKVAKGVPKSAQRNQLQFKLYKKCLFEGVEHTIKSVHIVSKLHIVTTENQEKVALRPYDDKRFIRNDCINTLAWGHKDIQNSKRRCDDEHAATKRVRSLSS